MESFVHWKIVQNKDDICWLTLDQDKSETNVLSIAVLDELENIVSNLENTPPKGVIFKSGKTSGFIAGADVKEFLSISNEQEAMILIKRGQKLFTRIELLNCPTLAVINGFCMGGGTELALACDYRIALDDSKTKIGLPEVKLGIHPAYGGVVRTTGIVNPLKSLELMLSGRALSGKQAKAIGLIDHIQPKRQIERAAQQIILTRPAKREMDWQGKLLSLPVVRNLVAEVMKKQVSRKVSRKHYPAPFAIIDLWRDFYGDRRRMMEEEANSVARLVQGDTVRNLIRVFFLQTRLKGLEGDPGFKPQHVHVIGAGIMGGDIASWCAVRGFTVTLEDREPKYLSTAMGRAHKLFDRKFKNRTEKNAAIDRLIPDCKGSGISKADVVIEAIYENIEAKHEIYKKIEPLMKADAVLATNTSSIPLETLSTVLEKPDRLVGVHFFNPVALMPLVEIVKTKDTSQQVIDRAVKFTQKIGKLPLPVKSSPGFLVNRILLPYLIEAITIRQEGVAAEAIDKAALDFGMPMGPVELADTVGLDICQSVAKNLAEAYGFEIPAGLEKYIDKGNLGKKSGKGFYTYNKGKPIKDKDADLGDQKAIQNRLIYRLLNESAACLKEGIVDDMDLLDGGVIFGTGFAPFRGGPLNYSQSIDVSKLVTSMQDYQKRFGDRFQPSEGWDQII